MNRTQCDNAYQHIRNRLFSGALRPGGRLSPVALARELGVSHIPVREAISRLHSEGFVVHVAHKGAFVMKIERHDLADLIDLRSTLELRAASLAARRISGAQLQDLDDTWRALSEAAQAFDIPPESDLREQLGNWLLADLAFHMVLLRAAGNRRVIRVLGETRAMTQMFAYRTDPPEAWANPAAFAKANLEVHRAIYDAVRRRDPRAARSAMAAHMRRARKNILSRFDWAERQGRCEQSPVEEFPDSMRRQVCGMQQDALPKPASQLERSHEQRAQK